MTAPEKDMNVRMTASDIDPETYVVVRNGFQGHLVYKSAHTGETFYWDAFGDEQEMTLRELKNARNSGKRFFTDNWFMFDDDWVVDYLGVGQYYRHALSIDKFDELFVKPADEVKKIVSALSPGQKKAVSYRARQLINEGKIDSRKVVAALEEALGTQLVER